MFNRIKLVLLKFFYCNYNFHILSLTFAFLIIIFIYVEENLTFLGKNGWSIGNNFDYRDNYNADNDGSSPQRERNTQNR